MSQNLGLNFIADAPSFTGLDTMIQALVTTRLDYFSMQHFSILNIISGNVPSPRVCSVGSSDNARTTGICDQGFMVWTIVKDGRLCPTF